MARHRGKHSNDDKCFDKKWLPTITEASHDLSFLLGKGYGIKSSLALVGNHYKLNVRQQRALSLICCPSDKINSRKNKTINPTDMTGKTIVIDGFNLLINIEAMLSGGYIFIAQDGCYRDIASIHGSYKKVAETLPAIRLIDETLKRLNITHAHWYFDQPVSNAGMLKTLLYQYANDHHSPWDIDLVFNPDKTIIEKSDIIVSNDSVVIDKCTSYFNLSEVIAHDLLSLYNVTASSNNDNVDIKTHINSKKSTPLNIIKLFT